MIPTSARGSKAQGMILESRADIGCAMEKGIYYYILYNYIFLKKILKKHQVDPLILKII